MQTLLILLLTISFISCGKDQNDKKKSFSREKYDSYVAENQFQYLDSKIVLTDNFSQIFLVEAKNIKNIFIKAEGLLNYKSQGKKNLKLNMVQSEKLYCDYDIYSINEISTRLEGQHISSFFDIYLNKTKTNLRNIDWKKIPKNKFLTIEIVLKNYISTNLFSGFKFLKGKCLKDKTFQWLGLGDKISNKITQIKASPKIDGSIAIEIENHIFVPTSSPK